MPVLDDGEFVAVLDGGGNGRLQRQFLPQIQRAGADVSVAERGNRARLIGTGDEEGANAGKSKVQRESMSRALASTASVSVMSDEVARFASRILLPALSHGRNRSAGVRRLLGHHLPELWRAAGASRRVGNRLRAAPREPRSARTSPDSPVRYRTAGRRQGPAKLRLRETAGRR